MKLGIISDCIHYKTPDGRIGTENHILLRQFQALCSYFSETTICCPFGEYNASKVLSIYPENTIHFYPVPVVGGKTLKAKMKLLSTFTTWFKGFKAIDRSSDVVYQRFPNNLNIPGFFYFLLKGKKTFATYTGTWHNHDGEPVTYRFQRWLLSTLFKGPVWVYSTKPLNSKRIFAGFSPSYTLDEWNEETLQVQARLEKLKNEGLNQLRLISVGTLAVHKNHSAIIKACAILKAKGVPFNLTIVGDGILRNEMEQLIKENFLQEHITLAGKKNQTELRELYRQHDFVVQAPLAEGFGKVPIEGFFHGLIPVINNVSMALHITDHGNRGFVFNSADEETIAAALMSLKTSIQLLPQMIINGREFAKSQTLNAWANEYFITVKKHVAKA